MPARMVDGDALWRSDKLTQVNPPSYRAEYANMIPLALADGWFECNARRVWADVYSYNRPDISVETVEDILNEFERVKLLSRKSDEKGKVWGFWIGIEKRLPCDSQRDRYKQGKPVGINEIPVAVAASGLYPDKVQTGLVRIGEDRKGLEGTDATALFGQAKRIYRRYVGKSIGSLGPRESQWRELVNQYGETVLSAVEIWAQEGGKGLRNVNWPLAVFLKNAEEFIEAAKQASVETEQKSYQSGAELRSVEAAHAEFLEQEKVLKQELEEQDATTQRIAEDPSALFGQ